MKKLIIHFICEEENLNEKMTLYHCPRIGEEIIFKNKNSDIYKVKKVGHRYDANIYDQEKYESVVQVFLTNTTRIHRVYIQKLFSSAIPQGDYTVTINKGIKNVNK